jgi:hypothetical protein
LADRLLDIMQQRPFLVVIGHLLAKERLQLVTSVNFPLKDES